MINASLFLPVSLPNVSALLVFLLFCLLLLLMASAQHSAWPTGHRWCPLGHGGLFPVPTCPSSAFPSSFLFSHVFVHLQDGPFNLGSDIFKADLVFLPSISCWLPRGTPSPVIYDSIYHVACSTAVSQGQTCQLFTAVMVSFLGHTHSHRPLLVTDSDKHHQSIPAEETGPVTLESGLVSPPKLQNSHLWPDTAIWGDMGRGCPRSGWLCQHQLAWEKGKVGGNWLVLFFSHYLLKKFFLIRQKGCTLVHVAETLVGRCEGSPWKGSGNRKGGRRGVGGTRSWMRKALMGSSLAHSVSQVSFPPCWPPPWATSHLGGPDGHQQGSYTLSFQHTWQGRAPEERTGLPQAVVPEQ